MQYFEYEKILAKREISLYKMAFRKLSRLNGKVLRYLGEMPHF